MRTTFQEQLNQLEATLQEEGALVLRALRGAINALEQRDEELADEVIAFDDDVDDRYLESRRASSLFSRARRRSRATCGSCLPSSTSTSTSSEWRTTA